jgi:hypothetical protein
MEALTRIERESPVVVKVADHLRARLAMLRRKNDADADAETTAALRGQIRECKDMLYYLEGGIEKAIEEMRRPQPVAAATWPARASETGARR